MPSCVAIAGPRDAHSLIAALIAALVAATRDRFPYSRADGTCSSCSYVIQRTRRIIREVEKMRQVNVVENFRGAGDGNQLYSGIVPVATHAGTLISIRIYWKDGY